jgi:hypothetical protein
MKEQKEKRRYEKPKVMSMQQLAESLGACAAGSADCGGTCGAGSAAVGGSCTGGSAGASS